MKSAASFSRSASFLALSGPRTIRPVASASARMQESAITVTDASAWATGLPACGSMAWERRLPSRSTKFR